MKMTEHGACQILGLGAPTTLIDARKAYRALARELHPDVGGDEERFKQVAEAYQFLVAYYEDHPRRERGGTQASNRGQRSRSDSSSKSGSKSGSKSRSRSQSRAQSQYQQSTQDHRQAWRAWRDQVDRESEQRKDAQDRASSTSSQGSTAERDARSGQRSRRSSERSSERSSTHAHSSRAGGSGEIVEASVVPTWSDSMRRWGHVAGARLKVIKDQAGVQLKRWYRHSARSIFEPGRDEKLKLEIDQQALLYGKQQRIAINRAEPCPRCQIHDGEVRQDPDTSAATWAEGCEVCHGEGRVNRRQELSIYVPAGADHGHKLKVNDKGGAGLNGAPDGDLILLLSPLDLPRGFSRKGANLELQQAVSAQFLRHGGVLPIETLRGQVRIKVPPNFRSGGKLVIPNEGLPTWGDVELLGSLTVCLRAMA